MAAVRPLLRPLVGLSVGAIMLAASSLMGIVPAGAATIVTTLAAKQSGEGQVTLNWSHNTRPASQRVTVYRTGKPLVKVRTVALDAAATSTVLRNLTPNKRYQFVLQTSNPNGKASSYVTLATRPAAIKGLKISWVAEDLFVTWNPVGDQVLVAIVVSGPGGYLRDFAVSGSSAGVRVTGADPAASYRITAVASNPAGLSTPTRLTSKPALPDAPVLRTALLDATTVQLSWEGTADTWRITVNSPGNARDREVLTTTASRTTVTVDRLSSGATYRFSVVGTNIHGTGKVATSAAVTLTSPVSAPRDILAIAGTGTTTLSWNAGPGSIPSSYKVSWRVGTSGPWLNAQSTEAQSLTVRGLNGGELHQFQVEALNADGESFAGTLASSTPLSPTTPVIPPQTGTPVTPGPSLVTLLLTPGDGEVALTWSGDAVQVQWQQKGASSWSTAALNADTSAIRGLTNGVDYVFQLVDKNQLSITEALVATPRGLPQPVRALQADARHSELTITWEQPANSGGVALYGYKLRWRSDSASGERFIDPTLNTVSVTGLNNGDVCTVTITAVNEFGDSSSVSVTATPVSG
jgi:hypothetical protein